MLRTIRGQDCGTHVYEECDRLRRFAEWVAGYESERQLVGSGALEKARAALDYQPPVIDQSDAR